MVVVWTNMNYEFKGVQYRSRIYNILFIFGDNQGCVQEVEGLFWHVRCNTKLKKQTSINLHGYFETLTQ